MSIGKATAPSAAEMLFTMEVRARMFPCSGESVALRRSANKPRPTHLVQRGCTDLSAPSNETACVNCTHPRCCSSACTARECCSTQGCCSRCCPNWARWTTTPVTTEMHTQKLLSVNVCYGMAHPAPHRNTAHTPLPLHPVTNTCAE